MSTKISCQYCKKEYTTLYSLNIHQKTAKFCLNIQKQLDTINTQVEEQKQSIFICEYCNKSFNLKYNYNVHLSSCKQKKTSETNNKLEEYSKKLEETEKKLKEVEQKLEEANKKIELNEVEQKLKLKELEMILTIQSKDQLIQTKDQFIHDLNEQNKIPTTVINNNNSTNTTTKTINYNLQYNKMVDKLIHNKQDILQDRFKTLNKFKLINDNNNKLTDNFCNHVVNQIKDMVFCTDISRGNLVMKDEDDRPVKIASEAFVINCFQKAKTELLRETGLLVNDLKNKIQLAEDNYDYNLYDKLCIEALNINANVKINGSTETTKAISISLVKNCEQLAK